MYIESCYIAEIGKEAFAGCSNMCYYTQLYASVSSIGEYAFASCFSRNDVATDIDMSNLSSIVQISEGVFKDCKYLYNVDLPSSITNIGDYAFQGCCHLTNINLPSSISFIGTSAFADCS